MSKKIISINEQAFNIGNSPFSKKGKTRERNIGSPVNNKYKKELLSKIKKAIQKTKTETPIRKSTNTKESSIKTNQIEPERDVFEYFSLLNAKRDSAIKKHNDNLRVNTDVETSNHQEQNEINEPIIDTPIIDTPIIEVISPPSQVKSEPFIPKPPHNKNIPYGILKGGSKPTYRTWKKYHHQSKFNSTRKKYDLHKKSREYHDEKKYNIINETDINTGDKLKKIQDKINNEKNNEIHNDNISTIKVKKTTLVKKIKPGKNKSTHQISVIISNETIRCEIKKGINELLNKSIIEIKRYLKGKNLLSAGSLAPNVLMRQMYLQNYLGGGSYNVNKKSIVENFMDNSI